ncbi:3'-5' exonuclease [Lentzea sp. NPDC003310]|uniref:3'-5' exonuclease n=1 Tax=Lentzea sp. NPDC003310 TaxID=3154447 RepID=UPI0033A06438
MSDDHQDVFGCLRGRRKFAVGVDVFEDVDWVQGDERPMATVVLAKEFQKNLDLDGSLKPRAWDLLRKLSSDEDLTGLRLKMPKGAKDSRVRVARVTDNYRAVLFAAGSEHDQYFVLVAIHEHDKAYEYAEQITMRLNPTNGVFEVLRDASADVAVSHVSKPQEDDDRPRLVPYTVDELVGIGILRELAEQVTDLREEDQLQDLCLNIPEWQGDALLDLATGSALDDVRRRYAQPDSIVPTDADDPAQLRDSLSRAGSQMQFVVVEGDEHLRRMLDGDFAAWRTFLHPDQRDLIEKDRKGAFRVAGGAGTGKTVVAMHRAVALAERSPAARVLVTTYTRNLAVQLRSDLGRLTNAAVLSRIEVVGIDRLARDIVARVQGAGPRVLGERDQLRMWERALGNVPELSPDDRAVLTPYFMSVEHQQVILGMNSADLDRYLVETRRRLVKISRVQRARVWRVVEEFTRLLAVENATTHAIVAAKAADIAHSSELPVSNRYDHVVVDEAQDLAPAHWRLLRGVVPVGPNDLFICEDAHQRIYGRQVVLGRFGIETRGRSQKLTLNYRTTRQLLGYATKVLSGVEFVDLADKDESTTGYRSLLAGPEPDTYPARSWQDEKTFVVETVREWLSGANPTTPGSIAVLASQNSIRDELAHTLQDDGIPAAITSADGPVEGAGVQVATMHRAKGTEFARVIVVGVDDDRFPSKYRLEHAGDDERAVIEVSDRCLLYVACTRARDQLVVTWTGEPSRFLPV